jgi:hypothetical protein
MVYLHLNLKADASAFHLQLSDTSAVFITADHTPTRPMTVYRDVQFGPAVRRQSRGVARVAPWAFMLDNGYEQLLCTNVLGSDVTRALEDRAVLVYTRKGKGAHIVMDIGTDVAVALRAHLDNELLQGAKYLVEDTPRALFGEYEGQYEGRATRFRFNRPARRSTRRSRSRSPRRSPGPKPAAPKKKPAPKKKK